MSDPRSAAAGPPGGIAIVGMAGRFPGASGIDELWQLLRHGVDAVAEPTDEELERAGVAAAVRRDPRYVRAAARLHDVELFDAGFFGLTLREAELMDPQHRLFLECAWHALESAACDPAAFDGAIGVFAGSSLSGYLLHHLAPRLDFSGSVANLLALTGNDKDYLASHLAYKLDLRGPAVGVQTACSTSLVAVHLACQSLLDHECDMALAGGVTVQFPLGAGYLYEEGGLRSPDGRCRAFSAGAAGTVFGSGAGVVALRRLDDALAAQDRVLAVIRGSAINNDGAAKIGYTAPSVEGEARVIAEALAVAGVEPSDLDYVEAHGTGTPLGDPIEAAALAEVFGPGAAAGGCVLGSIKTNLGHLEAAAGVAGLIKTVLALWHGELPPSLHFAAPNPQIDFARSPFRVNVELRPWPARGVRDRRRRAGVSSFGIGGTNAHVVVEEAPVAATAAGQQPAVAGAEQGPAAEAGERPLHLLALSARDGGALRELAGRYAALLREDGASLADIAWSAHTGRAWFPHRLAVVAESAAGAAERLAAAAREQAETAAREQAETVAAETEGQGAAVRSTRVPAALEQDAGGLAALTQDASALAAPVRAGASAVPGLHRGEVDAERPLRLGFLFPGVDAWRGGLGRSLHDTHSGFRAMIARCDAALHGSLPPGLTLGGLLGGGTGALPESTGCQQPALFALQCALCEVWRSWGVQPAGLLGHGTGEAAAAWAAGALSLEDGLRLAAARGGTPRSTPAGTMTAVFIGEERREPIPFADGIAEMRRQGIDTFLEIGPGDTLLRLGRRCTAGPDGGEGLWLPSRREGEEEWETLLGSLAALIVRGQRLDGAGFDAGRARRRVELPLYPFQRQRCWIEAPRRDAGRVAEGIAAAAHPLLGHRLSLPVAQILFGSQMAASSPAFLADHRVFGVSVLPGAAYLEMALAAAGMALGGGTWELRDVQIHRALTLPASTGRTVHLVLSPRRTFEVHSQAPGETGWILHASGEIHPAAADRTGNGTVFSPAAAIAGLAELDPAAHYDRLRAHGLDYGAAFRGIAGLWCGGGQAVARIVLPAALGADADGYGLHPVLLDSCFQAVGAALGAAGRSTKEPAEGESAAAAGDPFLPVAMTLFRRHAQTKGPLWCVARMAPAAGHPETRRGEVRLFDERGLPVAEVRELVSKRARSTALHPPRESWRDALLQLRWIEMPRAAAERGAPIGLQLAAPCRPSSMAPVVPAAAVAAMAAPGAARAQERPEQAHATAPATELPAPEAPPVKELADLARQRLAAVAAELDLAHHRTLFRQLDALVPANAARALRRLGWQPREDGPAASRLDRLDAEEMAARLGIAPRHHRLFAHLLGILAAEGAGGAAAMEANEPGSIEERLATLRREHAACRTEVDLFARCGEALSAVLTGEADPLPLLFTDREAGEASALYGQSPFARALNEAAAAVLTESARATGAPWAAGPDGAPGAAGKADLAAAASRAAAARLAPPEGRALRVLEIGGGTGGTTAALLPLLPAGSRYLFTDVSPFFLSRAAARWGEIPGFGQARLDIEKDPGEQGVATGGWDIVVAANVLHATADLRRSVSHAARLLAPGGLLLVVEGTAPQRWLDLVFGLTEGWWRFADRELRPDYPLLGQAAWKRLLAETGFAEVAAVPDAGGEPFDEQTLLVARHAAAPRARPAAAVAGRWLVLADRGGLGERLAGRLAAAGHGCHLVAAAGADPWQREDFARAWREATASGEPCHGTLFLRGLDATRVTEVESTCSAVLHLVQSCTAAGGGGPLWLVTRGAQVTDAAPPAGPLPSPALAQAPLWGLGRTIALEHSELRCRRVDLDPLATDDENLDLLIADVTGDTASSTHAGGTVTAEPGRTGNEDEVAFRNGARTVPRLVPLAPAAPAGQSSAEPTVAARGRGPGGPVRLVATRPGTLDGLRLVPLTRRPPGPGEVEIEVRASAINFKDVLNVLGMVAGGAEVPGGECAGEVVAIGPGVRGLAVGQPVVAIAAGSHASHVTVRAEQVAPKPDALGFAEAASVPIVFLTAEHALFDLAHLRAGERVLIHAAAGGVGLAALALAREAGGEVLATAGSVAKRRFLRSLGVSQVFDSRSAAFAPAVRAVTSGSGGTGGGGVDVVLNSLTGPAIAAGLGLLRPGGRFLEIGRTEPWQEARAVAAMPHGGSYLTVALDQAEPAWVGGRLRGLLSRLASLPGVQHRPPLPLRVFPLADAAAAFRFVEQARHIGKVVLSHAPGAGHGAEGEAGRPRADRSYLITGGLGGLGLAAAGRLAERGARHLALLGRGEPDATAAAALRRLAADGVEVLVLRADVANPAELAAAIARIDAELPPLAGVIHAAGILDDGLLGGMDGPRFARVLAPKVSGAWELHERTAGRPLDFFVLFSSVAALLGAPGQGNHAAANAFLDALAHARRARGLPALSINWGAWSEIGAAAARGADRRLREEGFGSLSPAAGLDAMDQLLAAGPTQAAVLTLDRERLAGGHGERLPAMLRDLLPAAPTAPTAPGTGTPPPPIPSGPDDQPVPAGTGAVEAAALAERLRAAPAGSRRQILVTHLQEHTARVLGLPRPAALDTRRSLFDQGLDSLLSVDLRNAIKADLAAAGAQADRQRPLPSTLIFDYPSLETLATFLAAEVLGIDLAAVPGGHDPGDAATADTEADRSATTTGQATEPETRPAAPGAAASAGDGDLAGLSEEELGALLAAELAAARRRLGTEETP